MSQPIKCWACKEELESDQKFCTNCNHWQNWRRYTVFSSTILSLLVALITVGGFLGPQIAALLVKPNLALNILGQTQLGTDETVEIAVLVENWGDYDVNFPRQIVCDTEYLATQQKHILFVTYDGSVVRPASERLIRYRLHLFVGPEDEEVAPEKRDSHEFLDMTVFLTCKGALKYDRDQLAGAFKFDIYGNLIEEVEYSKSTKVEKDS